MRALRWVWRFLQILVPFGVLVRDKPRHYLEMLRVLWENRGRWAYALRILRHGVCDGCSLGPRGLRDDVIPGVHLCLSRLKLLRLNTMGKIPGQLLENCAALRTLSNEELHRLGRVPYPLIRRKGEAGFSRLSWAEATTLVAEHWKRADPDRIGLFVTSRGITNETYYALQKLARIGGTAHIDTCARLCHAASTVGLKETIGYAAPTLSLKDWIGADLIVIIGSNLPNNQPVSTKYLYYAKKAGTRIAVVNPFREPGLERYWVPSVALSALFGTKLMDDFFPVRPGGDIAFMSGVLKALDEIGGWDEKFVTERTSEAGELRQALKAQSYEELCSESGIPESELKRFAALYAKAKTAIFIYSMGLTQYEFGVENVKMVVNLALARGMIGRPHTGVMPIRGHSGVQGSAECGADPDKLPGGVALDAENIARFETAWDHAIPHQAGLRAAHLLERAGQSGLDLLYLVGGNHLETMPDRAHAKRALESVKLRVHQDIVLNSSTLLDAEEAVIVLPAQTRYEQKSGGTSTSTERRIRYSPEIPGPRIDEARAEWEIPCLIGQRLEPERSDLFHYPSTREMRAEMAELMPLYRGIEKLEREGDSLQWGGPQLGAERFPTPDGRAHFSTVKVPRIDLPAGKFLLTMRRGKQFNSMTYGNKDPLLGGARRNAILLDPKDLSELGLSDGQPVTLKSDHGALDAVVRSGPCRPGHVQGYWPECNVLLGRKYDPQSGEPDYNTAVSIERVQK
ncbi:MAG TPA: FdhF/YdeP family oxidoreductase [Polyangiaceae bacterium]|nr:FdhF/YdeP family oxidoreductase [Polyangiaceae bacterium]